MKRIFSLALVLLIAVPLLGCSSDNSNDETGITGYVMKKEMVEDKTAGKVTQNEMFIKVDDQDINYTLTARSFTSKEDFKKAYLEIDREELIYVSRGSKYKSKH